MKSQLNVFVSVLLIALLSACAGPTKKPNPTRAMTASTASAKPIPKFYIITFDPRGLARDRSGTVVDKQRVLDLLAKGEIDRHTGIRIEVPRGLTDHDASMRAFARAQQTAKIFNLLSFEAIVVAFAK